ncbi:MAG: hypothetical protein ACFCU6_03130 [Balneolaceae bacterium]
MKKIKYLILLSLTVFFASGFMIVLAQSGSESKPTHKLSGLIYSDYYFIINNHNEDLEGENGFWARRIYFTYDNKLSENLTARFRLEMNSPGDFTTNAKLEPFVKDLYLNWSINENHSLIGGISSTPTWNLVESVWGYRSLEKSPLDLQKLGSSRDFGIAVQGEFGDSGIGYHAMLGNGSGTGAETNKFKKYMLSVSWWLTDNFVVQGYGDYERRNETNTRNTFQALLGYMSDNINIGAMYAAQTRTEEISGADDDELTLNIASVFTNMKIVDKWTAILRADRMFDPNPQGPTIDFIPFSDQAESTFLLFGIDFQPVPRVHIIPNIETVFYDKAPDGTRPNSDVIFRTTLYYTF